MIETVDSGTFLRAVRHGFYYSGELNIFIRIIPLDKEGDIYSLEICPKRKLDNLFKTENGRGLGKMEHLVLNDQVIRDLNLRKFIPNDGSLRYSSYIINGHGELAD